VESDGSAGAHSGMDEKFIEIGSLCLLRYFQSGTSVNIILKNDKLDFSFFGVIA